MKYEVYLTKSEGETVFIEADSPYEAIEKAEGQFLGFRCQDVTPLDGIETTLCVAGYCEGCEKAILDNDEYVTDPEGIYLHKKCAEGLE